MPIYNYRCTKCNNEFETMSTIANMEKPLNEPCPTCNGLGSIIKLIVEAPVIGFNTAPGLKQSDNFRDRLKEIKKRSGSGNTVGDSIW